jgi:hypothetical protein
VAICDRCNGGVETGASYCVYSKAPVGLAPGTPNDEIGGMLFCESCADDLFTEKVWREAKDLRKEGQKAFSQSSGFDGVQGLMKTMREMHDFDIAMTARGRGLSPIQAREEARQIAEFWWQDRTAAEKQLSENAHQKNWWQFWK